MSIQIGDSLPNATLRRLTEEGPQEIGASDFCKGRKVVLFAVPGAFTPTCHRDHMPTYLEQAEALKAKGVDEIACVAVNDVFVLDAWAKQLGAGDKVTVLSDGNAEFTEKLGLSFDGSGFGLGTRSKRYAMVVDDGVVKALEVEDSPGECTVTKADAILRILSGD